VSSSLSASHFASSNLGAVSTLGFFWGKAKNTAHEFSLIKFTCRSSPKFIQIPNLKNLYWPGEITAFSGHSFRVSFLWPVVVLWSLYLPSWPPPWSGWRKRPRKVTWSTTVGRKVGKWSGKTPGMFAWLWLDLKNKPTYNWGFQTKTGYTVIPYEKLSKMACSKGNMTMNIHKPYSDLGIPYFLSNPHRYGKPIGVPGTESTHKYFHTNFHLLNGLV